MEPDNVRISIVVGSDNQVHTQVQYDAKVGFIRTLEAIKLAIEMPILQGGYMMIYFPEVIGILGTVYPGFWVWIPIDL